MPETTDTFTRQMHLATVRRHADDAVKATDALFADLGRMTLDDPALVLAHDAAVAMRIEAARIAKSLNGVTR